MKKWFCAMLLFVGFDASANEGLFYICNWCESRSDFVAAAESRGRSLPVSQEAEYDVIVANDVDGVLFKGTMLVENWGGPINATAVLFQASSDLHLAYQDFKSFHAAAATGEVVVTMPPDTWPPGNGGGSFVGAERWVVGGEVVNHPLYLDLVGEHFPVPGNSLMKILFKGVSLIINGEYPVVIVVFGNGDVAKYKITAPYESGALAIEYVEGSARDKDGKVLPDGSGTSTGGSYVEPYYGSGGTGLRIYTEDSVWVICSRVGSGPWTCYIQEDQQ